MPRGPSPKSNRLQLPPPTTPNPAHRHENRTGHHQRPPQPIRRHALGIQRRDDEVNRMQRQGEIGHEFRSGDEEEKEDDAVFPR